MTAVVWHVPGRPAGYSWRRGPSATHEVADRSEALW
jgi:hypothetical protein